jgi:NAD+ diphosphatase
MLTHAPFKFCPRCGGHAIAVHEKNGMRCSECGFVYFHNCASAVIAIIEVKGGILVAKRNQSPKKGHWDLPGGFSDYHESLENAVEREIREELGLELSKVSYFGSAPNAYRFKGVTYFTIDAIFVCTPQNPGAIKLNNEISEIFTIKPSDIDLDKFAFESTRTAVRMYRDAR